MTKWPGCKSFTVLVNVTKKAEMISFDSRKQFELFSSLFQVAEEQA